MRSPTWYSSVGHALAVRQKRLVFSQIQDHVGTLEPPDGSADDFADTVFELGENSALYSACRIFCINACLANCDGDPAKVRGRDFLFKSSPTCGVRLDAGARRTREIWSMLRNDFFRDDKFGERLDIAVFSGQSPRAIRALARPLFSRRTAKRSWASARIARGD